MRRLGLWQAAVKRARRDSNPQPSVPKIDALHLENGNRGRNSLRITEGNTIYVDRDAAGYGWFVDRTPRADQEFRRVARSLDLRAVDRRAVDRIDLLTVVEHELGHIAGLQDVASDRVGLMKGTLDTGTRRLVGGAEADLFWACYQAEQARRREGQARLIASSAVR